VIDGISSQTIPLQIRVCFASLGHKPGDFPHSEAAANETIASPIYPELTQEALRHVVGTIARFFDAQTILPFQSRRGR
jgi:dTDP-4-amino-4,6-dideoxygalactose transaminase